MVWLSNSLWPGLVIWTLLYVSDYYLTIACARLYRAGVQEKLAFEGSYEITPYYQQDVDRLRCFSPRFVRALLLTLVLLSLMWWLAKQLEIPGPYSFLLGMYILLELAIHQRHLQNFFMFRAITKPDAVRGQIENSRPFMLRQSTVAMLTFAGLFAI